MRAQKALEEQLRARVLAVGILEPDLRLLLLGHVLDRGRFVVIPGPWQLQQRIPSVA